MKVSEIRSGGQSGIDESGIKAALAYGIPAGITFPRGWLYNDAQGHPHWNKVAFMQRFDGIERIQIPRIEFDVAQALHQDEPAPDVKSYNPGRDSVMLGVIAGDIIASRISMPNLRAPGSNCLHRLGEGMARMQSTYIHHRRTTHP